MSTKGRWNTLVWSITAALLASAALGQEMPSGSLLGNPGNRRPISMRDVSLIWQSVEEPQPIRLHDLITVVVDEKAQVISEGGMDRRRQANLQLGLKDWILLDGLTLRPDPLSEGDPSITGDLNQKYKTEADLETRDAMKFRIACRVVDIRPNGTLVIEGRRTIQNNEEVWEQSLTGVVRPEDILPNNSVLSENVADLRIHKREIGHVRDGYRRGWMQHWLDQINPF